MLRYEIKRIQEQAGITTVYVTHDQEEALSISERVVVMNEGVIYQVGTPEEIYKNPSNQFVASFIGISNILKGTVISKERGEIAWNETILLVPPIPQKIDAVQLVIRPEKIRIVPAEEVTSVQSSEGFSLAFAYTLNEIKSSKKSSLCPVAR